MPARLGPQNTKAILGIMVRDALDETGKNLLRLTLGRAFHGRCGRITSCTHAILLQAGDITYGPVALDAIVDGISGMRSWDLDHQIELGDLMTFRTVRQ
jgi:hypothetical protein